MKVSDALEEALAHSRSSTWDREHANEVPFPQLSPPPPTSRKSSSKNTLKHCACFLNPIFEQQYLDRSMFALYSRRFLFRNETQNRPSVEYEAGQMGRGPAGGQGSRREWAGFSLGSQPQPGSDRLFYCLGTLALSLLKGKSSVLKTHLRESVFWGSTAQGNAVKSVKQL